MARVRSQSGRLRKRCIKLLFFVLTFLAFVTLQYLVQFVGPAWKTIQEQTSGIPGWILILACLGVVPVVWVIVLGVDQLLQRLCDSQRSTYESVSSDDDTDDVETGYQYQRNHTREPKRKRSKRAASKKSTQGHSQQQGAQQVDNDEDSKENPTDVDVTVHPVDTTIAAGGEARVSPYYNVSLLNFSNDTPTNSGSGSSNRLFPSAPMMQGGPASFKREF